MCVTSWNHSYPPAWTQSANGRFLAKYKQDSIVAWCRKRNFNWTSECHRIQGLVCAKSNFTLLPLTISMSLDTQNISTSLVAVQRLQMIGLILTCLSDLWVNTIHDKATQHWLLIRWTSASENWDRLLCVVSCTSSQSIIFYELNSLMNRDYGSSRRNK